MIGKKLPELKCLYFLKLYCKFNLINDEGYKVLKEGLSSIHKTCRVIVLD